MRRGEVHRLIKTKKKSAPTLTSLPGHAMLSLSLYHLIMPLHKEVMTTLGAWKE